MKIKNVHINGFGKLRDVSYDFSSGLNLVSGGNEAGKTTLHKFIEAVFFGFFKPYSRNKQYTPDYDRYFPWDAKSYSGSLIYDAAGGEYTVSRNFYKQNEKVKFSDALTGEDLTDTLEFDLAHKLHRPTTHMDINSVLFENTVSIAQLSSVTDESLAKEVGELLVNTTQTYSSDISYKAALQTIEEKKTLIGTRRQSHSRLGLAVKKLAELKEEHERDVKIFSENEECYVEIKEFEEKLGQIKAQRLASLEEREKVCAAQLLLRYKKFVAAKKNAAQLRDILNVNVDITEEEYERFSFCSAVVEEGREQLVRLDSDEKKTSEALETCENQREKLSLRLNSGVESIKEDSLLYDGLISKLKKVKQYNADERLNAVKQQAQNAKNMQKAFSIATIALLISSCMLAAAAYFAKLPLFYYALGIFVAGVLASGGWIAFFLKGKKLEPSFEKFDTLMKKSVSYEVMCRAQLDVLKEKYSVESYAELKQLFERADSLSGELRSLNANIDKLKAAQSETKKRRLELKSKMEHYELVMKTIMHQAKAENEEELKNSLAIMRSQGAAKARYESAISMMKDSLGEFSESKLAAKAKEAYLMHAEESDADISEIDARLSGYSEEEAHLSQEIARLRGYVSEAEKDIRPLNELEEEIALCEDEISECEKLYAAYDLAQQTIIKISREIHGDFANVFNAYVSETISKITSGKYNDVKISDKMEITVKDNASGKLIPVSELSGGTIDQLYFAVRFALADLVLRDKTLPVFLDDCFVQYDDERLKNILKYIADVAANRQIILFTCRSTEKRVLDEAGINYKEIIL